MQAGTSPDDKRPGVGAVALYRRYRPQRFSEVVGQGAVVDILLHALGHSRAGHAYMFSGPRGCGKTSVARILAKALNCTNPDGSEPCGECPSCRAITSGESLDVIEVDGASNNNVDDVRELKSHVTLAPFSSKYKVYIIDEVHMLSTPAFNALLKTLEETPPNVVFILATTEPHKVPVTIRSRCQHMPFRSIGAKDIFEQLGMVCASEGVNVQPEALWEVARRADGAMRDALSMLEQVINRAAGDSVAIEDVEAALGAGSRPALERWLSGLRDGGGQAYSGLKEMLNGGSSAQRVFEDLFSLVRNLWLANRWPNVLNEFDASEQEKDFIRSEAPKWDEKTLRTMLDTLVRLISQARLGVRADVLTGILLLELTRPAAAVELHSSASTSARALRGTLPPLKGEAEHTSLARSVPASRGDSAGWRQDGKVTGAAAGSGPVGEVTPAAPLNSSERDVLLSAAREKDFVIYCALLDADAKETEPGPESEGRLILEMRDRYCYETLRLERLSAALSGVVRGISHASRWKDGVILKFGDEFTSVSLAERPAETSPLLERDAVAANAMVPQHALPPAQSVQGGDEPGWSGDNTVEQPFDGGRGTPAGDRLPSGDELPFGNVIRDVSRLMKGEVVLVRRAGAESGDTETDDTETGGDAGEGNDE